MEEGRKRRGPACGLAACRDRVWNMCSAYPATSDKTKVCPPVLMTANPQAEQKPLIFVAYLDEKDKLGQSNQNLTLRDLEKG